MSLSKGPLKDASAPWPGGWETVCLPRAIGSGARNAVDREYISPVLKLRFRSRKAVDDFISIINEENGSEERAWDRYQALKGKSIGSFVRGAAHSNVSPASEEAPASKEPTGGVMIDLASDDDDEEDYWEVDTILGKRKRRGLVEFLIKWKGCPEGADTSWEPRANLCDAALREANQFGKPIKASGHKLKRRVASKPAEIETMANFFYKCPS